MIRKNNLKLFEFPTLEGALRSLNVEKLGDVGRTSEKGLKTVDTMGQTKGVDPRPQTRSDTEEGVFHAKKD